MDTIFIHELKIETRIGIYAWEQKIPQIIQLDLEIGLPPQRSSGSEVLTETIDYSAVVARIQRLFCERHFSLLEAAADAIAVLLLGEFGAPWLRIDIAKLAPLHGVRKIGVIVERGKRE
jgi:dihydroneopterin aldolase